MSGGVEEFEELAFVPMSGPHFGAVWPELGARPSA